MRAFCGKAFVFPLESISQAIGLGPISGINVAEPLRQRLLRPLLREAGVQQVDGCPSGTREGRRTSTAPRQRQRLDAGLGFLFASKTDTERTIVGLASHKPSIPVNLTGTPIPQWYSSESEFYFDCHGNFPDDSCNGQGGGWSPGGGYSMYVPHWRARMRRVHKPSFFTDLINVGVAGLFTADNNAAITNGVKNVLDPVEQDMGGLGGAALDTATGMAVGEVGSLVTNAGTTIGTQIDGNGVINRRSTEARHHAPRTHRPPRPPNA